MFGFRFRFLTPGVQVCSYTERRRPEVASGDGKGGGTHVWRESTENVFLSCPSTFWLCKYS